MNNIITKILGCIQPNSENNFSDKTGLDAKGADPKTITS